MHILNVKNYRYGRPLGVIFPDGALWKEQRRFVLKCLRDYGFGKKSEENIQEEGMCAGKLAGELMHAVAACKPSSWIEHKLQVLGAG